MLNHLIILNEHWCESDAPWKCKYELIPRGQIRSWWRLIGHVNFPIGGPRRMWHGSLHPQFPVLSASPSPLLPKRTEKHDRGGQLGVDGNNESGTRKRWEVGSELTFFDGNTTCLISIATVSSYMLLFGSDDQENYPIIEEVQESPDFQVAVIWDYFIFRYIYHRYDSYEIDVTNID